MTCIRNRNRMRLLSASMTCLISMIPLSACAEIEVGAEVAKRVARAASPTPFAPSVAPNQSQQEDQTQLAQATESGDSQSQAISPFLKPAPEIFEATGLAIWDGKRTLQGVWVAHPLATSARRVRIFNENNGQAVDGALFKRDTASSGASILISSEAAQLLGMGVGTPAELRIVAVSPVQRNPEPSAPSENVAAEQTDQTIKDETTTATTAPEAAAAPTPTKKPAPKKPEPAKIEPIVQEPKPVEPKTAVTEPIKTEQSVKPAQKSTLKLPYIQAGIFGVPDNAKKLIRRIESKNLPAVGRSLRSKGKKLTRVLAGPFLTTSERSAALRTIRKMGLKDAAPVRR